MDSTTKQLIHQDNIIKELVTTLNITVPYLESCLATERRYGNEMSVNHILKRIKQVKRAIKLGGE